MLHALDLPSSDEVESGKQHANFVKEISTNGGTLRVDCEIVEGTESYESSDFVDSDWVSDDSLTAVPADGDNRSYDSDSPE